MANSANSTITSTYLHGESQFKKFFEKEFGNVKSYEKELQKAFDKKSEKARNLNLNKKWDPDAEAKKEGTPSKSAVKKAIMYTSFESYKQYGKFLKDIFGNGIAVNYEQLDNLMKHSNVSARMFDDPDVEWGSKEGASAMKRFTAMLIENDRKKYQYYFEWLKAGDFKKQPTIDKVLRLPLPKTKEPSAQNMDDLKFAVNMWSEKLAKANSFSHKNSPEFNAMEQAINSLKEGVNSNVEPEEIGARLEALQEASMKYVTAKGVGTQFTKLGKDRMDAALGICSMATNNMDFFASNDRIKQVASFELEYMGREISRNGVLDFSNVTEKTISDFAAAERARVANKEIVQKSEEQHKNNVKNNNRTELETVVEEAEDEMEETSL